MKHFKFTLLDFSITIFTVLMMGLITGLAASDFTYWFNHHLYFYNLIGALSGIYLIKTIKYFSK